MCILGAVPRDVKEQASDPRGLKSDDLSAARGIQAIKEDPDMMDSELSVCVYCHFIQWIS